MAHENDPDYANHVLPLFRIVVDGMYYCGELVSNTYTFNDPFSPNSFHTAPGGKTALEFSEDAGKAKFIEGRNNLASHVKRVIDFVTCAAEMPKEIKIERTPFPIPLTLNIDYFLDIECENSRLKAKIAELDKLESNIYNHTDIVDEMSVVVKTSTDNNKCWWTQESDPEVFPNLWRAGCGNSFYLDAEKPSDNHMKYCCYCGKEIAEGE